MLPVLDPGTQIAVPRRIVYAATGLVLAMTLLLAVAWPEVRAGLAVLGVVIAWSGWWLAHRFVSRPMGRPELLLDASLVLGCAIAVAVLLPTTRTPCDCPAPRGAPIVSCHCQEDSHGGLRAGIALAGAGSAAGFLVAARRRSKRTT